MLRRAFLGALLGLPVLTVARPLRAQSAAQALADVDRFRAVLRPMSANVALRRDGLTAGRVTRTAAGLRWADGSDWTSATPDDDMVARLLAAFCGTGPLAEAVAGLGYTLEGDELGFAPSPGADGDPLVRRIGGPLAAVWVEPGIHRPRLLRIGRDETSWSVIALTYGALSNGWFPERLDVKRGEDTVASLAVTDAAPSLADLAPLDVPDAAQRPEGLAFPRIPL